MNAADLSRIVVVLQLSRDRIVNQHDITNVDLIEEIDTLLEIIKKELEKTPVKVTRTLRRKKT